jgi:RNA polymerase sigma factor (sigma-70 family)
MPTSELNKVIEQLRAGALRADSLSDGQLLELYVARRDESAFAAIIGRHGPMVLGVCRRVALDHHDAEDAFQATFLVLVRKAASVVPRSRVGPWLYGVACRTALRVKVAALKRRAKEKQRVALPDRPEVPRDTWHALQPLIDQELGRLPDKYRLPVVLCDLEGRTRKETAQQLGWPEGTVSGRLARARELLARRLVRHGMLVSGEFLAAALAQNAASAAGVPAALVASTLQAASLFARGQATSGAIPAQITLLVKGALNDMLLSKLKTALAVTVVAIVLGASAGLIAFGAFADEKPGAAQERGAKKDEATKKIDVGAASDESKLLADLLEAARAEWADRKKWVDQGKARWDETCYASARRLLQAELEQAKNKNDRVAAWRSHFERMAVVEADAKQGHQVGRITTADYQAARYLRLEAEIGLERAKRQ